MSSYSRSVRLLGTILVAALVLGLTVACDSGDSSTEEDDESVLADGGFTATISGAASFEETGLAQFSDPADSDAPGWQFTVELTKAAPIQWQGRDYYFEVFVSNRQLKALPSSGSYSMASYFDEDGTDQYSGEFSLSPANGGEGYVRFEATGGTVTFTSVETDRTEGEVEFTGTRYETEETVNVKATFNATRAVPTI